MRWLSKSVDELIASELRGADKSPTVHDAVVVGSGYGGAVSALRLAEAGVKVLVLERGEEWTTKEFSNDIGNAFSQVRFERGSRQPDITPNISGYESGLYDLHIGEKFGALVGNGLGGTSLINANVVIKPDPRVFAKNTAETESDGKQFPARKAWPRNLQPDKGHIQPSLETAYDTAFKALGAERFKGVKFNGVPDIDGVSHPYRAKPQKLLRHGEFASVLKKYAGENVQITYAPVDLTVNLGADHDPTVTPRPSTACIGCGDCVSGCNQNAKKSLDTTYLAKAYEAGARMFTGVSVMSIYRSSETAQDFHWVVRYVRTQARSKLRDGIPVGTYELHTRHLILSAGTFGSTEILLRSTSTTPERVGLALSDCLGERLSTNGDSLAFGFMLDKPVRGIGTGSKILPGALSGVGPTITSSIHIKHLTEVEKSVLIQEGAIPGAIAGLFHEMISTTAAFAQLDEHSFKDSLQDSRAVAGRTDVVALQNSGLEFTQTLLAMGHDDSLGVIEFDPKQDRTTPVYKVETRETTYVEQDKYLEKIGELGGIYIQNPMLDPLPRKISKVLDSPVFANAAFTVHPLGGCCMADDVGLGVVNDLGQVFAPNCENNLTVYPGLYVLDGSIIPTSLGANPLLTITALAERAMASLVRIIAAKPGVANVLPTGKAALPPHPADTLSLQPPLLQNTPEVKVHFTEAMRGNLTLHDPSNAARKTKYQAHLLMHLPIPDLTAFWADGSHQIVIPKQHDLPFGDREQLPARLRLDWKEEVDGLDTDGKTIKVPKDFTRNLKVMSGSVSILPVPNPGLWTRFSAWARTILTWLLDRGFQELVRKLVDRMQGKLPKKQKLHDGSAWNTVVSWFKMVKHASEIREMTYRLNLFEEDAHGAQATTSFLLHGKKSVGYPASWRAILRKLFSWGGYLDRANIWEALGRLKVDLEDARGLVVGSGELNLDLLDMTKMHAPQLGLQRDTPNALLALAGYPLWFGRLMIKTRLWDFRLPDYPETIPVELNKAGCDGIRKVPESNVETTTPWPVFPPLRIYAKNQFTLTYVKPEPSIDLEVPISSNRKNEGKVKLKLTRYKNIDLDVKPRLAGDDKGSARIVQVKSILMINGFAQSTLSFVPQEHKRWPSRPGKKENANVDEPGLAEFFYEQGFDVWLFDYRTSAILEASKQPSTMDQIAEFDIPRAVDRIIETLHKELTAANKVRDDDKLQIYAFAHCVGSASLGMSILGGFLQHDSAIGKIAGVTFSQMQAFCVGSETAQERIQIGGIARDALGIAYFRLSAAERKPTASEALIDRLFASLPVTNEQERCPHENGRYIARPGICTCKRMTGVISRLLKHDMIKEETHDKLAVYFGRANTSLLVHCGRCLENERLVNADGQNIYVTDENIANYLRMPVAILHGAQNVVLDVESARRTFDQLCRVNFDLSPMAKTGPGESPYALIIADDYAHFDCTIGCGKKMQAQILQPLKEFYDRAWTLGGHFPKWVEDLAGKFNRETRSEAKAPLAGPLMGWSRICEDQPGRARRLLRLWIEVDDTESDEARYALTVLRRGADFIKAQLWEVQRMPLGGFRQITDSTARSARLAFALADLELPLDWAPADYTVDMFSVHEFKYNTAATGSPVKSPPATGSGPNPIGSPSPIAKPITPEELRNAIKRPGQLPGLGNHPMGGVVTRGIIHPAPGLELGPARTTAPTPLRAAGVGSTPLALHQARLKVDALAAQDLRSQPEQIVSIADIGQSIAETLIATLAEKERIARNEALRGKPATPSRKSRKLPPPRDVLSDVAKNPAALPQESKTSLYLAKVPAALLQNPKTSAWTGLRFLAACCRHPGLGFEDKRADASFDRICGLLKSDRASHRDFMLMLGDQIYADATANLLDSPSPIEKVALRNRHAFNTRGFNGVTSQLPTYMVIDDHELGDNWSQDDRDSEDPIKKDSAFRLHAAAWATFKAYQYVHSPRNVNARGFNYQFAERGIPFFVLDTRTQRRRFDTRAGFTPKIVAEDQLAELEVWLMGQGHGSVKPKFIVCGAVLAPGLRALQLPGDLSNPMAESWQMAVDQRRRVLNMVRQHQVKNVVFLAGDYHCSARAELAFENTRGEIYGELKAYAIVTPPLYAPLPGANTKASDVLPQEWIDLGGGAVVSVKAAACEGMGFADIHVSPLPNDQWNLAVNFYCLNLDAKAPQFVLETVEYLLT